MGARMALASSSPLDRAQRGVRKGSSLSSPLRYRQRLDSGFTLIEVMVALLVVGMTLLGLGMAQNKALRNTQQSEYRSLAIYLAYDMADRIRANRTGWRKGYFDSLSGAALDLNCERNAGCTSQQMAQHDKFRWQALLNDLLPQGAGQLARNGETLTVTINWQQRGDTGAEVQSYSLRLRV